jgi:hypothetical protein
MEKRSSSTRGTGHGLADVAPAELAAKVAKVEKLLDEIDEVLEGTVTLDEPQRKTTLRLRGDAEVTALTGVLQFAAAHEALFEALADEDEGIDRTKFETLLVSGRLANARTLSGLVTRLEQAKLKVSDTVLYATSLSKPIALKAWEVAKVYVDRYPEQKALLAPAVNFYRGTALAGAKTRARKKAEAAASASTPPATATPQK